MKNRYRSKAVKILVIVEILLFVCIMYRLAEYQTLTPMSYMRDGTMFAAGLVVGPAVLKDL